MHTSSTAFYAWNHTRPYDDGREGLQERDGYFLDLGGAGDTTDEEQFWRGCASGPRCHPARSGVPVYYELQSGPLQERRAGRVAIGSSRTSAM
jgi:hypothetical protein